MKILAFCFFPAYTPPGSGGESRLFNFYRHLSQHHRVTLLTSAGPNDPEQTIHHGADFVERRIPKDAYFARTWQTLLPLGSGGDLSAPCLAACGKSPTRLHEAYLEEYGDADVIVHDFPFMIDYDIFLGLDEKPRVYNAHNCESRLYASLHPAEKSAPIQRLVRDVESRLLKQADILLYCSEDDLEHFRSMAPDAPFDAIYAPHGIEPVRPPRRRAIQDTPLRALFIGSAHPPNVLAARFIVDTLAPAVPHVQFDIVGNCLPEGKAPANVHRHGFVDEPSKTRLMSQADVALNPMEEGSGANIKVLDYLASGLPVLSTSFGIRGIEAQAGADYVCATLDEFAAALVALARDPERRARIAQAGQRLALESYTWAGIAKGIAGALVQAVDKKARDPVRYVVALNDYDSFASRSGGGTRTSGLYQAVSDWLPVIFLCFSADEQLAVRREAPGIVVITVPKTVEQQQKQSWYAARFPISVDDIVASQYCRENFFLNAIYRVLRVRASHVVLEHCYMLPVPTQYGDRFIYSSHNDETRLKAALLHGHPDYAGLMACMESLERYAVENAALTVCVSHDDAASLMVGKAAAAPTIVVRNGASQPADPDRVRAARDALVPPVALRSAVFLGSAHGPNIEAARQVIRQVAAHCPDVQFHFVGSVCNAIQDRAKNIHLWGEVDDAKKCAILQSCGVALNPVVSGGGSNIKMADYIANGLFVITTDFGLRGYLGDVSRHLLAVPLAQFPQAIERSLADAALHSDAAKALRRADFQQYLSMRGLGSRFVQLLKDLEAPRKRILFVTHRYVAPAFDDADGQRDRWLSSLANSGHFDVDVVAPEVSQVTDRYGFAATHEFDAQCSAPVDLPNVRFARFLLSSPDVREANQKLSELWDTQPRFERVLNEALVSREAQAGLTWGWGEPERQDYAAVRWAMTECAVRVPRDARVVVCGQASHAISIAVSNNGALIEHCAVTGPFRLELDAQAGELVFTSSSVQAVDDPRPLSFVLTALSIGDESVDIGAATLLSDALRSLEPAETFERMDRAARVARAGVRLTDCRGPWSRGMEAFIRDHVASYDLIVACDNGFRPAVFAIDEARRQDVPSVLISHANLEDGLYHFPDLRLSEAQAGLVLAESARTVEFLRGNGCNAMQVLACCDTDADADVDAQREQQFVQLCLDRATTGIAASDRGAQSPAEDVHAISGGVQ